MCKALHQLLLNKLHLLSSKDLQPRGGDKPWRHLYIEAVGVVAEGVHTDGLWRGLWRKC